MTAKHDQNARRDEIDVIIDDILADPTRAGELKALLRRRFVPRPAARQRGPLSDGDDFWDNVPV